MKMKDQNAKREKLRQKTVTRPKMALSWTKNISFLVLNVKASRLRRRGREKRRREGEIRKKEEEKEKESQGMEY